MLLYLFEIEADNNGNYSDEPLSHNCDDPDSYCYLTHNYTEDQDETVYMIFINFQLENGSPTR